MPPDVLTSLRCALISLPTVDRSFPMFLAICATFNPCCRPDWMASLSSYVRCLLLMVTSNPKTGQGQYTGKKAKRNHEVTTATPWPICLVILTATTYVAINFSINHRYQNDGLGFHPKPPSIIQISLSALSAYSSSVYFLIFEALAILLTLPSSITTRVGA